MEIVLDKEERMKILQERLQKTMDKANEYYNFAEAAAICGNTPEEVQYRHQYYVMFDEAEKIKKAIADEGKEN